MYRQSNHVGVPGVADRLVQMTFRLANGRRVVDVLGTRQSQPRHHPIHAVADRRLGDRGVGARRRRRGRLTTDEPTLRGGVARDGRRPPRRRRVRRRRVLGRTGRTVEEGGEMVGVGLVALGGVMVVDSFTRFRQRVQYLATTTTTQQMSGTA